MKKLFKNIIFVNFVPIAGVHLIFLVFWTFSNKSDNIMYGTYVTTCEIIFDILIIPIYLLIINFINKINSNNKLFILNILIMIFAVIISNSMHYFNWGITTGMLFKPDWGSLILFRTLLIINILSILLIGLILQVILLFRNKKELNIK